MLYILNFNAKKLIDLILNKHAFIIKTKHKSKYNLIDKILHEKSIL